MKKVILITGGSEGLGYEMAKLLAPKHAVVITAANGVKLAKAAKALKCGYETFDVSDHLGVQKAVKNVFNRYKHIDVLINNAAIWTKGRLEDKDPHLIRRILEVNVLGTILVSRAVVPGMKKRKQGTILNIISQTGIYALPERSVYAASKFAITGFTKSLEMDVKGKGIRVIGIYPGLMKTKLFDKAGIKIDLKKALHPKEVAKLVKFIVESDPKTNFPEVGIKYIEN
jgi:NAD(P)-dependent dehydrogenase (short-subunit alcohol dehydrogenase family)